MRFKHFLIEEDDIDLKNQVFYKNYWIPIKAHIFLTSIHAFSKFSHPQIFPKLLPMVFLSFCAQIMSLS